MTLYQKGMPTWKIELELGGVFLRLRRAACWCVGGNVWGCRTEPTDMRCAFEGHHLGEDPLSGRVSLHQLALSVYQGAGI